MSTKSEPSEWDKHDKLLVKAAHYQCKLCQREKLLEISLCLSQKNNAVSPVLENNMEPLEEESLVERKQKSYHNSGKTTTSIVIIVQNK